MILIIWHLLFRLLHISFIKVFLFFFFKFWFWFWILNLILSFPIVLLQSPTVHTIYHIPYYFIYIFLFFSFLLVVVVVKNIRFFNLVEFKFPFLQKFLYQFRNYKKKKQDTNSKFNPGSTVKKKSQESRIKNQESRT